MSFFRQVGDKFIIRPGQEDVQVADEDLIPPGMEPKVFDLETGLGMRGSWSPRYAKDDDAVRG